jgi:hypothetical protein
MIKQKQKKRHVYIDACENIQVKSIEKFISL